MRKPIVLASLMLALLTLIALMPAVKAVTSYSWDGLQFVDNKYAHPDRDYYNISPYSGWSKKGSQLYHNQIDEATSYLIKNTALLVCGAIGAGVGAKIGGVWGAIIGATIGGALGLYIGWASEVYFLDEEDCIWWWISTLFADWVKENADWLGYKCISNPNGAQNDILYAFLGCGYLRVGCVTYYDALGIGNPHPPIYYTLTISIHATGAGTTEPEAGTHAYVEGTAVTVKAYPIQDYEFWFWNFDGTGYDGNPFSFTMNSCHTLKAYFDYIGDGGGGGGGGGGNYVKAKAIFKV